MKTALFVLGLVVWPGTIRAGVLRIWRDCGEYMSEDALSRTLPDIVQTIKNYSGVLEGVEVLCFAAGEVPIFTQRAERFYWGQVSETEESKLPLQIRLFKNAHQSYLEDRLKEHGDHVDGELKRFTAYIAEVRKSKAPCLRFTDLAVRMAEENLPLNLLLTHGCNDCSVAVKMEKPLTGLLVIGLFPRAQESHVGSENSVFNHRRQEMLKLFPTASIVRPFGISKALGEMLSRTEIPSAGGSSVSGSRSY